MQRPQLAASHVLRACIHPGVWDVPLGLSRKPGDIVQIFGGDEPQGQQTKRHVPHLRAAADGGGSHGFGAGGTEEDTAAFLASVAPADRPDSPEDGSGFMIFSDYGQRLRSAMQQVLPAAHNPCCTIHFERNILSQPFWKDVNMTDQVEVIELFKTAVKAPTKMLCDEALEALAKLSMDTYTYIDNRGKDSFCAAYLPLPPLYNMTANDAEGFFGQHHQSKRTLSLFALVQSILNAEAGHVFKLKKAMENAKDLLSPTLQTIVTQRRSDMLSTITETGFTQIADTEATIGSRSHAGQYYQHLVNLEQHLDVMRDRMSWCTCGVSYVDCAPCAHVLFALEKNGAPHITDTPENIYAKVLRI